MNIDNVMEFFYEKVSTRIRNRKQEKGLNCIDIYLPDEKLVSKIISNKRTKNNPYLLTEAVLLRYVKNSEIKDGILPKLDFKRKELIWGDSFEISLYLPELFKLLLEEVCRDSSNSIDVELILCDYIPYAHYYSYWNIILSKNAKGTAFHYCVREDDIITNIWAKRAEAVERLYKKCSNEFYIEFMKLVDNEQIGLKELHKREMQNFIDLQFIPLLKSYNPNENSLGKRVRDIISADLSRCARLISFEENELQEYYSKLNTAACDYIEKLRMIQEEYDS